MCYLSKRLRVYINLLQHFRFLFLFFVCLLWAVCMLTYKSSGFRFTYTSSPLSCGLCGVLSVSSAYATFSLCFFRLGFGLAGAGLKSTVMYVRPSGEIYRPLSYGKIYPERINHYTKIPFIRMNLVFFSI